MLKGSIVWIRMVPIAKMDKVHLVIAPVTTATLLGE
jgi:hypothetical protein